MATPIVDTHSIPRASLSSLPIEIKTIIVNLAKLQDDNYKNRINSRNKDEFKSLNAVLKESKWRGKSLNALFLVNKEFSNLAAIHIFKYLSSVSIASLIFKFRILFRQSHLIRSVVFVDKTYLSEMLTYIPTFTNLQEITINGSSITTLFGALDGSVPSTDEQSLQLAAFSRLGPQIVKLSLVAVNSATGLILRHFNNLKELEVSLDFEDSDPNEDLTPIGSLLAELSLTHLKLSFLSSSFPSAWTRLIWNSMYTLKSCELELAIDQEFKVEPLEFLNFFSNTLEILKLNFHEIDGNVLPPVLLKAFTKLIHLKMKSSGVNFSRLLDHFKSPKVISVAYETTLTNRVNAHILNTNLSNFISRHHSSLRNIELHTEFLNYLGKVQDLCYAHEICFTHSAWSDNEVVGRRYYTLGTDNLRNRRVNLEKAFNLARIRLLELEKSYNVDGVEEMYDNCKWLRAILAEMED